MNLAVISRKKVFFWFICKLVRISLPTNLSFFLGLNAETPQVSYVKAIDVWMGACTAFIFAALIEFTVVNYLSRKHGCCASNRRRKYEQHSLYMTRNGTDQQTQVNTNSLCVQIRNILLYPFVCILHVRDIGRQCQSRITTYCIHINTTFHVDTSSLYTLL